MRRALIMSSAVATALVLAVALSPVYATCNVSNPLQHILGGYFTNCPDKNQVKAFAYALSTPANNPADTTCPNLISNAQCTAAGVPESCCTGAGTGTCVNCNTAAVDLVCENNTSLSGQGSPCQPEAGIGGDGVAGDGNVTILFDWQLTQGGAFPGCPDPSQQPKFGRNFVQVVANDGSGLLVTVPFSFDLAGFMVDMAEPDSNPAGPLACSRADSGISVQSYDGTTLCGNTLLPRLHTDCDAGTWGATGGGIFGVTCDPGSIPPVARGKLYSRTASCGSSPDTSFTSGWSLLPVTPDAATGAFCVAVPRPPSPVPTDPQCAFVAASGMVGGKETVAAVGAAQLAGQNAPSARALNVRAVAAGGDVVVSWRTDSELDLAGFNVLADSKNGKDRITVSAAMIAANGANGAGASYDVHIPRGKFQGARTVYVESVLRTTGDRILSDPAKF